MAPRHPAPAHAEHRLPVLFFSVGVLGLHLLLPSSITFFPSWVVPLVGAVVLVPLVLVNPTRITNESRWSRWIGIGFALALAAINQVYVVRVVVQLVDGSIDGPSILLTAFAMWVTNVIAFALVYWELDGGGPVARRVEGLRDSAPQDFRFPQQEDSATGRAWDPVYFDYAYF